MSQNIYETLRHRNILRDHKRRLLAISFNDSTFQRKIIRHNETLEMVSANKRLHRDYLTNDRAREISLQNKKHLDKLLSIIDEDRTVKVVPPENYEKCKVKLQTGRIKDRQKLYGNIAESN
jgi:hypothetical protein